MKRFWGTAVVSVGLLLGGKAWGQLIAGGGVSFAWPISAPGVPPTEASAWQFTVFGGAEQQGGLMNQSEFDVTKAAREKLDPEALSYFSVHNGRFELHVQGRYFCPQSCDFMGPVTISEAPAPQNDMNCVQINGVIPKGHFIYVVEKTDPDGSKHIEKWSYEGVSGVYTQIKCSVDVPIGRMDWLGGGNVTLRMTKGVLKNP